MQALWEAMLNAVESRFISSQKRKSDKMNKVPGRNRKISFTTVYDNIRGLMDSFSVKRFVILFDHVDCLQNMDAPITEKLLRMSEVWALQYLKSGFNILIILYLRFSLFTLI